MNVERILESASSDSIINAEKVGAFLSIILGKLFEILESATKIETASRRYCNLGFMGCRLFEREKNRNSLE